MKPRRPLPPSAALLLLPLGLSCLTPACQREPAGAPVVAPASPSAARPSAIPPGQGALPPDTVVTVNGVPITEADIRQETKGDVHGALPDEGKRKAIVELLVKRELLRQQALSRGLDTQPEYLQRRTALDAQIRAFERNELPQALLRAELAAAQVTEAEARAWFDANKDRVATEVHVKQLMAKTRAQADALHAQLEAGTPFDDVARTLLPGIEVGPKAPWDLGFLRFSQMAPQWLPVVFDVPDGKHSGVIEGPGNRFWILQVLGKRPAVAVTFESLSAGIVERMRGERAAERQAAIETQARANAKIVVTPKAAVETPVD
jgi:hypothetical protein